MAPAKVVVLEAVCLDQEMVSIRRGCYMRLGHNIRPRRCVLGFKGLYGLRLWCYQTVRLETLP